KVNVHVGDAVQAGQGLVEFEGSPGRALWRLVRFPPRDVRIGLSLSAALEGPGGREPSLEAPASENTVPSSRLGLVGTGCGDSGVLRTPRYGTCERANGPAARALVDTFAKAGSLLTPPGRWSGGWIDDPRESRPSHRNRRPLH